MLCIHPAHAIHDSKFYRVHADDSSGKSTEDPPLLSLPLLLGDTTPSIHPITFSNPSDTEWQYTNLLARRRIALGIVASFDISAGLGATAVTSVIALGASTADAAAAAAEPTAAEGTVASPGADADGSAASVDDAGLADAGSGADASSP